MAQSEVASATPAHNNITKEEQSAQDSPTPPSSDPILSTEELELHAKLPLLDDKAEQHPFSSLYDKPGKHLIIFTRHAFCGMCQSYLQELCSTIKPEHLAAEDSIDIIFCGEPQLIKEYASVTNCPYPIYADPGERKLYKALKMGTSMDPGPKPDYQKSSVASLAIKGIVQGLTSGSNALKGGSFSQIGGDFLFEDGKMVWAHRMRNTRDHTSIAGVKQLLGIKP